MTEISDDEKAYRAGFKAGLTLLPMEGAWVLEPSFYAGLERGMEARESKKKWEEKVMKVQLVARQKRVKEETLKGGWSGEMDDDGDHE